MYFVDREKIESILAYIEKVSDYLNGDPKIKLSEEFTAQLAFERGLHIICEGIIDVGNQMIDGFIMRDPGSYEDIVDILEDENVIDQTDQEALKQLVRLRKLLVQDYYLKHNKEFQSTWDEVSKTVASFPEKIRMYLETELGPVSAFLPNDDKQT